MVTKAVRTEASLIATACGLAVAISSLFIPHASADDSPVPQDLTLSRAANKGVDASQANSDLGPIKLAENTTPSLSDSGSLQHSANSTLDLKPLYLMSEIRTSSSESLAKEASFDQSVTLREALEYVAYHGMPIKIARESVNYQRSQTLSIMASALPSFTMLYNISRADVFNVSTTSLARTFLVGFNYPVFQGGRMLYSVLDQYYREKAWHYAYKATANDMFFDVYRKYTNLLRNRVLMQVWAKMVEADQELLEVNKAELKAGTGTRFAILQAQTQLVADKQSLIQQQLMVRKAALDLNLALNYPMAINLVPVEETLSETSLFDSQVDLNSLIADALKHNPSLRQYEMFRLTAARAMQRAASALYPEVSFFTLYQQNSTSVQPPENGSALGGVATSAIASFLNSSFVGRVSNNALGQLPSFSPTGGSTASQGANTGPSAMPAASGGEPIATIQSGSLVTSGAVAPSIFGGGTGAGSGSNINGSLQAPAGIFPGAFRSFQMGFALSWSPPNLGLSTVGAIYAARVLARQALQQCNQELDQMLELIRSDYLAIIAARPQIDQAAQTVSESREVLGLARRRLKLGLGTNLEVIDAQKDYVAALTAQADAIVASNFAQARLLHDMGMISPTTLTSGYRSDMLNNTTKKGVTPIKP
jgi:outer membrane protein TolC